MTSRDTLDHNRCYRAVRARDARFDGRFFTGVKSTGIYCRPICPARCPRREQVTFFVCSAAAQDAGYRACRRCRPECAPGTPAWNGTSTTVARALARISQGGLDGAGNVDELSESLGVSARHLRRLFREHLGTSPISVAQARRVEFARNLVDHSSMPITRVATVAGFSSLSRFNSAFKAAFACSARSVRAGRRGPAVTSSDLVLRLPFRQPYDWDSLLRFFAARAIPGVEWVGGGQYQRSLCIANTSGCLSVRRSTTAPELLLTIPAALAEHALPIFERVRLLFDLRADPAAYGHDLSTHRVLAGLIRDLPGVRVPGCWDLFELAVRALLGQRISVKAATTLSGRLVSRYGERLADLERGHDTVPRFLFPTPERLARARCEGVGLPKTRVQCLRDLSRDFLRGELHDQLGPTELQERLQRINGIGPWTAAYVAMRSGGEPDVLPAGDLVLRRSASALLGRPISEAQLRNEAREWAPWRSYAALLLWRYGAENPGS